MLYLQAIRITCGQTETLDKMESVKLIQVSGNGLAHDCPHVSTY
jgi:hypothetical protein